MNKGDLFIFTTLSSQGLDIKNLSHNSKCYSIQHLNLFNPTSIRNLLQKTNFKINKIETPGLLDIDILYKQRDQLNNELSRFLLDVITEKQKYLIQKNIKFKLIKSYEGILQCEIKLKFVKFVILN